MFINRMNVWAPYPELFTNFSAGKENGNDNQGNKWLFNTLNDKVAESAVVDGATDAIQIPRCQPPLSCHPGPRTIIRHEKAPVESITIAVLLYCFDLHRFFAVKSRRMTISVAG
ncbi:hypothetical protein B0H13DRAFT_1898070 [Mycena leptocephala]|nr:hypothetical protein B0H13DRAFT_1898070 [Mycena leptocephala]